MTVIERLSRREAEVLERVAAGRTNKGVALDLDIAANTVNDHMKEVFRKLGVSTRAAAVTVAIGHGLIGQAANDAAAPCPVLDIGLDPGVVTGFAIWDSAARQLLQVTSLPIHEAMDRVRDMVQAGSVRKVRFEDARKRDTWFGKMDKKQEKYGAAVREGVGSVKRDCAIWEGYLTSLGVPFEAIKPSKGSTKWDAAYLKRVTGWSQQTNEHARDAAVLVYGR